MMIKNSAVIIMDGRSLSEPKLAKIKLQNLIPKIEWIPAIRSGNKKKMPI